MRGEEGVGTLRHIETLFVEVKGEVGSFCVAAQRAAEGLLAWTHPIFTRVLTADRRGQRHTHTLHLSSKFTSVNSIDVIIWTNMICYVLVWPDQLRIETNGRPARLTWVSRKPSLLALSADLCSLLGEGVAMCDVTKVSVSAVTSDASQTLVDTRPWRAQLAGRVMTSGVATHQTNPAQQGKVTSCSSNCENKLLSCTNWNAEVCVCVWGVSGTFL